MSISVRIVSDAAGRTADYRRGDDEIALAGVIQAKGLYTFYTVNADVPDGDIQEISLVLPVGGELSGMYRFPRVGERVLVEMGGSGNYLLGYLPSETNDPFVPAQDADPGRAEQNRLLREGKGLTLRYRQTGKQRGRAAAGKEYSEIGFFHEPTQWKPGEEDAGAYAETDGEYPKIDRIRLSSTGDIHSAAENHHRMAAKRFELLADCEGVDGVHYPLGDAPGDDPSLYAGDAHVRARNRVVIKAGEEIRLQVGRSAVIIRDDGITITSRKSRKDAAVPWDTVISLTPRDGIALFGQNLNMGAAYNFSLRESAGGAVSSLGGVMRLSARDLLAQSYCKVGYQSNMTDFIKLYTATARGMAGEGAVPSYTTLLPSLVGVFANVNWGYYASTSNYSDPAGDYAAYCGILLEILSLTYTSLDLSMNAEMKQNGGRDEFNRAALADQQEKVQEMLKHINDAGDPVRAIHNSFMHLTSSADAVLSGYDNERLAVNTVDSAVPTAGTSPSLIEKETARLQKEARQTETGLWFMGIDSNFLNKLKEL